MSFALSRRNALGLIAGLGASLVPGTRPCEAQAADSGPAGHLHILGWNPSLHPDFDIARQPDASVLTTIDIRSGAVRQTLLPMAGGHAVLPLSERRAICAAQHKPKSLVVDADHAVVAELTTSPGHLFGGHGWVDLDRGLILLPQRRKAARSRSDVGSLQVIDARTYRHLDTIETGGIHPHEIHLIPGRDELAVTHYGEIADLHATLEHNVLDPKLTILDAVTFRPKRHYPLAEFDAMVTHMSVDERGIAYLVLTQFVRFPRNLTFGDAIARLERQIGRRVRFDIPRAALEDRLLAVPLPLIEIDTRNGARRMIQLGDRHHLRSQSVAYNHACKCAIATYTHSDVLLLAPQTGEAAIVSAGELGLSSLRGVAEIPGTPYITVTASYRDAIVYDLAERRVASRYESRNYLDTHVAFTA